MAARSHPRVHPDAEIVPLDGSALACTTLRLAPGEAHALAELERDTLLFASAGSGALLLAGQAHAVHPGAAALVPAGETATLSATRERLTLLATTIGPDVDRHAPIGPRELLSTLEHVEPGTATGKRSFQVLYDAGNGSTRATLFMGYIPPGRAPWHYHLYDEIVWVYRGSGRLHLESGVEELRPGAAFRLRPRELHIVENTEPVAELAVLGIFTPAGSPSAAYLPAGSAEEYRIAAT